MPQPTENGGHIINANYAEICRVGNLEADFQQVLLIHVF